MENDTGRAFQSLLTELKKVVIGQEHVMEEIIVSFFTRGHVIIEGVPGTAKTLLIKTFSHIMKADFTRIQFTPDLMPSDIVGTHVFDMQKQSFRLVKGPIFTSFLLADEINRTPPKTQSALLEAMEERQVTIEGETLELPSIFMVCATQNPLEFEGTYPLPEAQLDRFMMKILIQYPAFNEEREVVRKYHQGFDPHNLQSCNLGSFDLGEIEKIYEAIKSISVSEPIIDYVTEIVHSSRKNNHLTMGASPRGGIHLMLCSKTLAALKGRDYVIPDDIKSMAYPVLRHRLLLRPDAEIEGYSVDDVIRNILNSVNVPR